MPRHKLLDFIAADAALPEGLASLLEEAAVNWPGDASYLSGDDTYWNEIEPSCLSNPIPLDDDYLLTLTADGSNWLVSSYEEFDEDDEDDGGDDEFDDTAQASEPDAPEANLSLCHTAALRCCILSIKTRSVTGFLICEIYNAPLMEEELDPGAVEEIWEQSDLSAEIRRDFRRNRNLSGVIRGYEGALVHAERVVVDPAHRGHDLALKAIAASTMFAARRLPCSHLVLKPFPFGSRRSLNDEIPDRLFDKAQRGLAAYYSRLGLKSAGADSELLQCALPLP